LLLPPPFLKALAGKVEGKIALTLPAASASMLVITPFK
jgi:hypothetical protein